MQRYFGFRVKVSDYLEPTDYRLLRNRVVQLLESRNLDLTKYRIYLHQLVLSAESTHFGVGGGLAGRVEKIYLQFSINQKQRRFGDMQFINHLFEQELAEDVNHYYTSDEIGYTIPVDFFSNRAWFQNILVTIVRSETRESHKKIKVRVMVRPTPQFLEQLRRQIYAHSATVLDIDFNKVTEFNKQTMLFMYDQTTQEEPIMGDKNDAPRTVINVNAPGNTVINDAPKAAFQGPITVFNNPALLEHLVQELSTLVAFAKDKPQPDTPRKELAIIEGVVAEAPNNPDALGRVKELGKWVYSRAETVGLGLVIELLKGKLGI
ncbi:hypothetical protein [Hydrogenophaga pseudoflava]|nr:hypothetical protein [Hydrogenophaga pseudoflava]